MKESIVIQIETSLLAKLTVLSQKEKMNLSGLVSLAVQHYIDTQESPKAETIDLKNIEIPPEGISLERLHIRLVEEALRLTDHNQTSAANLLGITRAKFRILQKKIGS